MFFPQVLTRTSPFPSSCWCFFLSQELISLISSFLLNVDLFPTKLYLNLLEKMKVALTVLEGTRYFTLFCVFE